MARKVTVTLSALALLVVGLLVAFGHVSTPVAGADYPVPQGPAAACDASVGVICGTYPKSLHLTNGPAGKVKMLAWEGDAYALIDAGGGGGGGSLVDVVGQSPIGCAPSGGGVITCGLNALIAIDAGTVNPLPVERLVPGGNGQVLQTNSSGVPHWSALSGDVSCNPAGSCTASALGGGGIDYDGTNPGLQYAYFGAGKTPFIGVSGPSSDTAPNDFYLTAGDAYSGASTNRTGGGFQFFTGQPATSNGSPGSVTTWFAEPTGSGSHGTWALKDSATSTNSITLDPITGTYACGSTDTVCGMTQGSTSGATAAAMTLSPQVSTNGTPVQGDLIVNVGAGTGTSGEAGVLLERAGVGRVYLGPLTANSAYNAICFGSASTACNTSSYAFLGDQAGSFTNINSSSNTQIVVGGTFGLSFTTSGAASETAAWNYTIGTAGALITGSGQGVMGFGAASAIPSTAIVAGGADIWSDTTGLSAWTGNGTVSGQIMLAPQLQGTWGAEQLLERRYKGVLTIASSTAATTIVTIPTVSGSVIGIDALLVCRDTVSGTPGDGVTQRTQFQFKNVAGTLTAATTNAVSIAKSFDTSMTTVALTATTSGTNVLIQAAGLGAATIQCTCNATAVLN